MQLETSQHARLRRHIAATCAPVDPSLVGNLVRRVDVATSYVQSMIFTGKNAESCWKSGVLKNLRRAWALRVVVEPSFQSLTVGRAPTAVSTLVPRLGDLAELVGVTARPVEFSWERV